MSNLSRRRFLQSSTGLPAAMALGGLTPTALMAGAKASRTMPWMPGKFRMRMRSGQIGASPKTDYVPQLKIVEWNAAETAIVICDMWSDHPCKMAARRVADMAPRMNATVSAARDHGALIIHAPSNGIHLYEDTAFRERMKEAPPVESPVKIQGHWECDPERETELPVETNRRGKDAVNGCDDPEPGPHPDFDRHQHPAIGIVGWDGISQSGQEMWNLFQREGIRNVILMGVHTNMCVLGRPFGIRQWAYLGKNVALCRDLTDALYDPRDPPFVSHTRGTELIIQHIEKYWAPSFPAADLHRVIAGSNHSLRKESSIPTPGC